jgi:RND family efflux transporter MFP subunit
VPGGRLKKGAVLVRIDSRAYQLAIKQQRAQLPNAQLQLEQEVGRTAVAEREWEILGKDQAEAHRSLVLREPHLAAAKENVEAVKSAIARAQLDLDRTVIRAPFNAAVIAEEAQVGQVVSPTRAIATLIGSDQFWVRVSVPVERLGQIRIPNVNASAPDAKAGSRVTVLQDLGGGRRIERTGHVLRLDTQLDPLTRTAQVIIGIENPLDPPEGGIPLLPGAFVRVEIEGRTQVGVIVLPARAIHEGDTVWAVGADDRLARARVILGYSDADEVHVLEGLEPGTRVVTSPLALPIDGMQVSVRDGEQEGARARSAAPPRAASAPEPGR